MEEERIENTDTSTEVQTEKPYVPRPAYQVWAARIGLVLAILFVIYQLLQIAGGGI